MIDMRPDKTALTHLQCSQCELNYPSHVLQTFSPCCHKPLIAIYDPTFSFNKKRLADRPKNMWRYFEMLPVQDTGNIVSLGEGMTPILSLERLAHKYGYHKLLVKDESLNPTGSFKARGLSMAVSKAKEFGIARCIIPTAGNAGGALAAYCARAGMHCTVVMPTHTPEIFKQECKYYGAELLLVDGLINDCAQKVEALKKEEEYFDVSTLKEPYRLEGKKTMGYEIAEQLHWQLPDVIVYPAGGGTGLIGIWKAFEEMHTLGWIKGGLPKMIAVQPAHCNPVMRAFFNPFHWKEHFKPQASIANGLAVPYPFGMDLMLQVLNQSNGTVCEVTEAQILKGVKECAAMEGMLVAPEGAAAWMAIQQLREQKRIDETQTILWLNTGSGYKYLENMSL